MFRALETVFGPEGRSVVGGQLYTADHPAVIAHPEWFARVADVDSALPVESATARPGEKRTTAPRAAKR